MTTKLTIHRLARATCVLLSLAATSGCVALNRGPVPEHVAHARQMSLRGMQAIRNEDWDKAESCFADAVAHNPADKDALLQYAEVLWRRGEGSTAIRHVLEAAEASGGAPKLRVRLGEMYLAQGEIEPAAKQAQLAIDSDRQLAGAWALLADIQRIRGESQEATASYHRALACPDAPTRVRLALAELYLQHQRPQRALSTLQSMRPAYGTEGLPKDALYLEGVALKNLRRYDAAVERLATAVDQGDASADLLYHLADAQWQAGRVGNARLAVMAALSKDPRHLPSQNLREQMEQGQRALTAAVTR